MQLAMKGQVEKMLPHVTPVINGQAEKIATEEQRNLREVRENAVIIGEKDGSSSVSNSKNEPQVGRNDPCPCGSGKKYKKCHGLTA
jgi:preprotein translocase subunit SecA